MKQSTTLNLVFINVLAASILACTPEPENKQCVDTNGNVVNESNCAANNSNFRWYYGGGLFNHGSHVSGGRFIPLPGHYYSSPSQRSSSGSSLWGGSSHGTSTPSVSRGGFGSSGHGFSGGG